MADTFHKGNRVARYPSDWDPISEATKRRRRELWAELGRCLMAFLLGAGLGMCFGAEHLIKYIR